MGTLRSMAGIVNVFRTLEIRAGGCTVCGLLDLKRRNAQ